jgi:hypothetical protein
VSTSTPIPGLLNYEDSDLALSDVQLKALETELDTHLNMMAKEVCDFVRRRFDVEYTPNAMTKLLKQLDYVYKKLKCVPVTADAAVQERFATETRLPLMAQANADHPPYFVDGMHPVCAAHSAFGWIKRGVTRELKSNHGRINVNINGALRWPDREVVHLQAEKISSEAMTALVETACSAASHRVGHQDCALQCELQSFGDGKGLFGARGLPHPTGVFADRFTSVFTPQERFLARLGRRLLLQKMARSMPVIFGSLPRTNSSAAPWSISWALTANRSSTLGSIGSARQWRRSRSMETLY